MLRVFEAFAGYGSQALALKKYNIEFKTVGISEIDKYAIQAYEAIHGPVKNYGDISKINTVCLPDFDLFTYSFPCQDISMAGKQKGLEEGSGSRSSLLWECQKIIEMKRPKYLMMENVKNLVGKKHKPSFDKWLEILELLGYQNFWKVINAKNCGVPQNRERVFCVSILKEHDNGNFKFYDDFDSGVRLKDILDDHVDEKYYLSEEMTNFNLYVQEPTGMLMDM
jgi:DNA (cytosine-5)-methyltransferase 1